MTLAFVFPGQGSQQVGMLDGFATHPDVRATFADASDALGEDLWALVTQGPAETLNLTRNTQPAMAKSFCAGEGKSRLAARASSVIWAHPSVKMASRSPALLPKCFMSCDSLVPACRAIADVLVCS